MSTTSSTLTSVLSALGGSTGIDVTSAVDAILYADRAPERGWQAQQATLTSQTSAINALETDASSLSDALTSLGSITGALNTIAATSSNTSLLTATTAVGSSAGNHVITIDNLASTGSWYSDSASSSSAQLATGSISVKVGSTTTSISTGGTSGIDTLDELKASINSQALGVTASIVTDSSGSRLALVSATTGSAGDFSVSSSGTVGFTRSGTGKDASLTVDGVPITSASNTVTTAISGVTLNLLGAAPAVGTTTPATPISLSLAPDTTSITSGVSAFVTAYNNLINDVNTTISYDKTTQTAGVLQSDSAAQGLQSALLASTNYSASSGAYLSLDSLGISTNSDGTLTLDSTKLASAIQSNNSAVAGFFQGDAFNGFAQTLTSTLDTYTDPSQGSFTVDLKSISAEYSALTDQTNTLEVYLASQQTILTAQYNAADIAIQQLPEKLKQINALLNPNSSSS